MKRCMLALLIVLGLTVPFTPSAHSIGYANCVSVSSAEVTKGFGEYVYTLQVKDLCDAGIRNYSLTLLSNKFSVPNVTKSSVILYGYATKVTFSLKSYVPGNYQPSLQISSNQDYERRVISLPNFSIKAPLDCIMLSSSSLDPGNLSRNYSIVLKNNCSELDSYSFSSIDAQMMGVGATPTPIERINSLSSYGTSFSFNLFRIQPGDYFPTLYLKDNSNSGTKVLSLTPFTIKNSNSGSTSSTSTKEVCVSGKNYEIECYEYPEWTYEICSSNQSGKVQSQSGSKWIFGWNFKGIKDLDRCYAKNPFLITINGTSLRSANLRLAFAKYQTNAAFYSNFKITVR